MFDAYHVGVSQRIKCHQFETLEMLDNANSSTLAGIGLSWIANVYEEIAGLFDGVTVLSKASRIT